MSTSRQTTSEVIELLTEHLPLASGGIGRELAGRYVLDLEQPLGAGGQGCVLRAVDRSFGGQPRAIKFLSPKLTSDAILRDRFRKEALLLACINSPLVLRVWDVGTVASADLDFLVAELVEGASLDRLIKRLGSPFPEVEALAIAFQAAEGLSVMHDAGVIHRDFKPGNLLWVGGTSQLKVCDLGLARDMSNEADSRVEEIFGTPGFTAPEQLLCESDADARVDIYSLGAALHTMLSGRLPVSGSTSREILTRAATGDLEDIDSLLGGFNVTRPTRELVETFLSRDKRGRPPTARAAAAAIREIAENLPGFEDARHLPSLQGIRAAEAAEESGGVARTLTWHGLTPLAGISPSAPTVQPTRNLPARGSAFFGRSSELEEYKSLVEDSTVRLLTLTGPGGVGKSAIAMRLGELAMEDLPGGVWFVDLSRQRSAEGIAHAIAASMSVPLPPKDEPIEAVAQIFAFREPMMLILDNFEHLLEHADATLGNWMGRGNSVTFVVTSRAVLGLPSEVEREVTPLPAPPAGGTVAESEEAVATALAFEAVQLFVERAQVANKTFELTPSNVASVTRLCTELEGMPLAIELAAARARILQPAQMIEKLASRFQLLASSSRTQGPRHRTMAGAIEWSVDLLSPWEKSAFLQCSAFRGGFLLEAAEEVIDLSGYAEAPPVMDVVQSLREQSLLRSYATAYGTRLDLYRTILDYARDRWEESTSVEERLALAQRHARTYLNHASQWNELIPSHAGKEAMDRIEAELQNLFVAQERALERGDRRTAARSMLDIAGTLALRGPSDQRTRRMSLSLGLFEADLQDPESMPLESIEQAVLLMVELARAYIETGRWKEPFYLVATALDLSARWLDHGRGHAYALELDGDLHRVKGDLDGATESYRDAAEIHASTGQRNRHAAVTSKLGAVLWARGRLDEALASFDESGAILRELGNHLGQAMVANNRGIVLRKLGDREGALKAQRRAERHFREIGHRPGLATSLMNRGNVEQDLGDMADSLASYAEAEAVFRELGQKSGVALSVGNRGTALWFMGDVEGAMECYEEAEVLARELGEKLRVALYASNLGRCLYNMGRHEEARKNLREAVQIYNESGVVGISGFSTLATLARLEEEMGAGDEARELARRAIEAAEDVDFANQRIEYTRMLEDARRIAGQHDF